MKRLTAPRTWPIKRKASVWVTKQSPGAHSIGESMPASLVLRDLLGVCDTAREAKRIIGNRELKVDGRAVKDPKAPIGIMDVIEVPRMGLACRMLLTDKGRLTVVPIGADEAAYKICRIEDKTRVRGGRFQLNLSGGRNILLDADDYKVGDSLRIGIPAQEVTGHYPLGAGAAAFITSGSQVGRVKTVKEVRIVRGSAANVVVFDDGNETTVGNILVIGNGGVEVTLPEASA
jgi:small subunit ribosomal protein S4e